MRQQRNANAETHRAGRLVNPAMVTLAREARGMTQKELAADLRISQGRLSKIESGLLLVGEPLLARLERSLRYPEIFFCRSDQLYGPAVSEFYHRKRQKAPARLLRKAHANINIFLMHLGRLLRAAELEENLPHYDLEEFDGGPEDVARAMRALWRLPRGPLKDAITTFEDAGLVVIRCDFGTKQIDAISRSVPGLPPVIFLNEFLPADRERLTLCHEAGHLVLHRFPDPDMEKEANRFAAELLMPEEDIRPHLDVVNLQRLAAMKPYWKVSMAALLCRAQELKKISDRKARYLWMRMGQLGYRRREPPELDFPKEHPSLLQEIFDLHCKEFGYTTAELAEFLGMHEGEMMERYKLRPAPVPGGRHLRLVR